MDGRISPHPGLGKIWAEKYFFKNEKNVTEKNEFERFNQRNLLHFLGYLLKRIFLGRNFFFQNLARKKISMRVEIKKSTQTAKKNF